MTLASQAFLLLFLPLGLLIYRAALRKPRQKLWFLLLASLAFYALAGWQFLPLLLGLSFFTFWLARKKRLAWGIALNLLALGVFKYWDFGAANLNALATALHLPALVPLLGLALPLGISFYVFKHIGYLVETRNGRTPATGDFLAFAAYSAFFPQVGAGPISDFRQTASQFDALPSKLDPVRLRDGLLRLSIGLVKKVLVADTLAAAFGTASAGTVSGLLPAWTLVVAYAVQLYFDFSGYTDMALGVACLFGVDLPPNFDNPYRAVHIGQFWERWHISLSTWFRYYLFSPLSRTLLRRLGSRRKDSAQALATLATMTLVGLWHGAAWTFVLWGLYHGLLLTINTWLQRRGADRLPPWLQRLGLVVSVLAGWALFLSPDASALANLLGQMAGLGGLGAAALPDLLRSPVLPALLVGIAVAFSGVAEGADLLRLPAGRRNWVAFAWGLLAALSLLWMGASANFLYMQF